MRPTTPRYPRNPMPPIGASFKATFVLYCNKMMCFLYLYKRLNAFD